MSTTHEQIPLPKDLARFLMEFVQITEEQFLELKTKLDSNKFQIATLETFNNYQWQPSDLMNVFGLPNFFQENLEALTELYLEFHETEAPFLSKRIMGELIPKIMKANDYDPLEAFNKSFAEVYSLNQNNN